MKYLSFVFLSLGLVLFSCSDITDSGKDSKTNQSDGNDQISSATPLALGETAKLRIQSDGDIDYYAVNVIKSGVMNVVLTELPSITICIEIVNAEEKPLGYNYTYNGEISNLRLPYLAKVGTYYIKINSGSYEKSDKEFSIKVSMDTLDTFEWNNDRANAYQVVDYILGKRQITRSFAPQRFT